MDGNGKRPRRAKATKEGSNGVTNKERTEQRKRKERELLERATDLAIELYEPALKELEKH